jgi:hypothetical protein
MIVVISNRMIHLEPLKTGKTVTTIFRLSLRRLAST